jgi:N-acetylneuraminic acid mutarotase
MKKPLPAELRDLVAGAVLQDKLYVGGGLGDGVGAVGTLEEYDPVTDDWVRRPSMPTPRSRAAAVAAGARLMVIGGVDRTGQISRIVEAYVP